MNSINQQDVLLFAKETYTQTLNLLEELCQIPAPSHKEDLRVEFCKNFLLNAGAKQVIVDSAKNVILPINADDENGLIVFTAHTDVVFPYLTTLPFKKDEQCYYAPGVGDDTSCLCILLSVAKYVLTHNVKPNCGILFVANSCEEGLGNLKGIRQIVKDYGSKIKEVYCFDGQYDSVVNKCVGSHRYKITFKTIGGHSFNHFGNPNAIAKACSFVNDLYSCVLPDKENSKTTYNVGLIEGGTSINTIAQNASVYYEYRSDDCNCLSYMKDFFLSCIDKAKQNNDLDVSYELIGERPCGANVDQVKIKEMTDFVTSVCYKHSRIECKQNSGSTDCNVPMSVGIPAICVGSFLGQGEHTREEKVYIHSIATGLKITYEIVMSFFNNDN